MDDIINQISIRAMQYAMSTNGGDDSVIEHLYTKRVMQLVAENCIAMVQNGNSIDDIKAKYELSGQ